MWGWGRIWGPFLGFLVSLTKEFEIESAESWRTICRESRGKQLNGQAVNLRSYAEEADEEEETTVFITKRALKLRRGSSQQAPSKRKEELQRKNEKAQSQEIGA